MADPGSAAIGLHALPDRFSGAVPDARPPRRKRTGLALSVTGVLLAVGVFAGLQLGANLGYDDASARFEAQEDATQAALIDVQDSVSALDDATDAAMQILDGTHVSLVDPASKDALSAAVSAATEVADGSDALLDTEIPDAGTKPAWFWELFAASDRLAVAREDAADLADGLEEQSPVIEEADGAVSDAGVALLSSAATSAAAFEAAHISAKNDAIITLRESASDLASVESLDQDAVASFQALQDAAAQVVSSEQVELAEKAGPLMQTRLAIEAFARSLAPGVLLEFDWSPIVNGAGDNGSMGGLTTWWWSTPGHAVIELSNSVAQQWPTIASKSLVAHEVGHAISVKCQGMYDASTQDSIEKWATAWAISMGYTDDANGVWAYGYPPQEYIDAAAGCR